MIATLFFSVVIMWTESRRQGITFVALRMLFPIVTVIVISGF